MSIARYITGQLKSVLRAASERRVRSQPMRYQLDRSNWDNSLKDPLGFYLDCVRFFHSQLPAELKAHRRYFHNVPSNRRGFGEDAFHVLWFLLLEEIKPANFLEIGVFRGQVISLVALWAKLSRRKCDVFGISPFSSAGDSVSRYRKDIDYYEDTLANFAHFQLPRPELLRAYSTDEQALKFIAGRKWDAIYIDGNHDYEVVKKDWKICSEQVRPGGVIVLDDSGGTTSYMPPLFASRGHPGPSQIAGEIDRARFREILQVGHNRAFQKLAWAN